jgi:hypothetical protein
MPDVYKKSWGINKIVEALAVRDTNAHKSTSVNIEGLMEKSLYIANGLDQNASIQIQGCYTDSAVDADWVNIGTAQTVNTTVKAIIGVNEVAQLKNYFPWIRITVTCASGPTTGTISATLMTAA